jgi:pantothenate synthetase
VTAIRESGAVALGGIFDPRDLSIKQDPDAPARHLCGQQLAAIRIEIAQKKGAAIHQRGLHPETLEDVDTIDGPTLLALAVRVGKARLIDNCVLQLPA